jgi:hypothetical protein
MPAHIRWNSGGFVWLSTYVVQNLYGFWYARAMFSRCVPKSWPHEPWWAIALNWNRK